MQTKINLLTFFLFISIISCKTIQVAKSVAQPSIIEALYKKQNSIDDEEQPISTLLNSKWVFDNYTTPANLQAYKRPTITFSEFKNNNFTFSGTTFINTNKGNLFYNLNKNKFLDKKTYKMTALNTSDKKLAYLEFRYTKDLKRINNIKVFKNKFIVGLEDSMESMVFIKIK
jgi:hypothetical protein